MNTRNVKSLIDMMEKSTLTALEVEEEGCKIRLERGAQGAVVAAPAPVMPVVPQQAVLPAVQPVQEAAPAPAQPAGKEVKSPMVGVFYSSASPESEPFATVGQRVKKGDVLCIIEAMKLMNEITSEFDGEITEVCAQNGQIIEYGQALFRIQ